MSIRELLARLEEQKVELSADGDELVVRTVNTPIDPALLALLRENKGAVLELLRRSASTGGTRPAAGVPLIELSEEEMARVASTVAGGARNVADVYPLAPLQEGILFHHLMATDGDPYLLAMLTRFDSGERLAAYLTAWQAVIDRHDILRSSVLWQGLHEPVQVVWRQARLAVDQVELDPAAGDVAWQLYHRFYAPSRRIDLQRAPIMRAYTVRDAASGGWALLLLRHLLIGDHVSDDVFEEELQAHLLGRAHELPAPLPFRQYVAQARRAARRAESEAFFQGLLSDVQEPTIPFGLSDAMRDGSSIEQASRVVDAELAVRLRERARRLGVSPAAVCHVAWAQVLARTSGREDVVFGSVLFGRTQGGPGADRTVGLFINTLPVRVRVGSEGVAMTVLATHRQLIELLRHENAPLALAQRSSGVAAPAPLFTALLNYRHSASGQERRSAEWARAWEGVRRVHAEERTNYPLTLSVDDRGVGFGLTAQASAAVGPERICALMHRALERLVDVLETAPDHPARAVDILPEAERAQVVEGWNATAVEYPAEKCVHELFEAQVARTPDTVAVVFEGETLSYAELNARANQLAYALRELGVGADVRVGLCTERSVALVVAVLGVLKAGGTYVPLDPSYPEERLRYLLADSVPKVVVTQTGLAERFDGVHGCVLRIDAAESLAAQPTTNPARAGLRPQHLAYVIYTSGSTGQPKGVGIEHGNAVNLVWWAGRAFRDHGLEQTLFSTSLNFDLAVFECFVPLSTGMAVRLVGDALELGDGAHGVTLVNTVPSAMQTLVEAGRVPTTVRTVNLAGEPLKRHLVERLFSSTNAELVCNLYGPTETTTYSTGARMERAKGFVEHIGRPVANTRVYVVDGVGEVVPVGVVGELWIGGAGVARGYLGRAELTAERFVADPFGGEHGARLYRTGDRVKWLPDGTLEYVGRTDFQVKVRGFRIELGEVEVRLAEHEGVAEAVVVVREDGGVGEKRLVAYYVGEAVEAEALRTHVAEGLPEYMVPAAYVWLESLPLTANGKVDRRALPVPDEGALMRRGYEAPVGETEAALAEVWAELLGVERVGRWDHFFELGGHSLRAVRLVSRVRQVLGVEATVAEVFERPVLAELARVLERAGRAELPAIQPASREERLPLSFAQQRLWFLEQLGGLGSAYHIASSVRLRGELDRSALVRALDGLVARHESLRTTFVVVDGEPEQRIAAAEESRFALVEHDLSEQSEAETAAELRRLMAEEAGAPFELKRGPLIRGRLIRLDREEQVLLVTVHHIVSDGWSMGVWMRELSALYEAYRQGRSDPLLALPVQYADYAVWQRRWVSGDVLDRQAKYWKETLSGASELLELPTDRPRPARQDHAGGLIRLELDEELTAGLKALGGRHGMTLFMTLLAGWAVVLSRLSGQREVVVGTPTANRGRTEIEGLIGFFVNTLALRIDLTGTPTVAELLERVKRRALEAQQHQDIPFEQVVELVQPVRTLAHSPLFQVMFAWQNVMEGRIELPGLRLGGVAGSAAPESADRVTAKFDLTLSLRETGGRIAGRLEYARTLFERETVERCLGYLRRVLHAMAADERHLIERLALLPEAERAQVVEGWNATAAAYPSERCVHELFEAQAVRTPAAVAVVFEGEALSYAQLNRRANRLAHHLRGLGVGPDVRVGICVERSLEMVVGLLAVLKAGGAYVPLDPQYPLERLHHMVEDSAPAAVLTQGALARLFAGLGLLVVDLTVEVPRWAHQPTTNPMRGALTPDHLAFVIYTSGSTGRPKGVMNRHRAMTNRLSWMREAWQLGPQAVTLQNTSFSFDVSVWEILLPLSVGARMVLARPESHKDLAQLVEIIRHERVTLVYFVWSFLQLFLEAGEVERCTCLRRVLGGGEPLTRWLVRRFYERLPGVELHNLYGPGEVAVALTAPTGRVEGLEGRVAVGRPVGNTRVYVLDGRREPVPVGVAGELYLGGVQMARGYLRRPGLTAERFVPDVFGGEAGGRLYRTGDMGRWLRDGTVEFVGRDDDQVKVRGFRIELGEIEARLVEHAGVGEAVVLAREDTPGDKRLVAYYVAEEALKVEALRTHLAKRLPEYMMPAAYVRLEALPLTPNGKLDRKALPAPEGDAYARRGYAAPVGETEAALAEIWAELLGVERVGRWDHFFELGGHSLLVIRLIDRLRRRALHAAVSTLFTTPILADLAAVVSHQSTEVTVPPNGIPPGCSAITPGMVSLVRLTQAEIDRIVAAVPGGASNVQDIYPLAPFQEGILFHHLLTTDGDPYLLGNLMSFESRAGFEAYLRGLRAVIERHDILRTAIVWEGLAEPLQVVWREVPLVVEEVELDTTDGDAAQALWQRFNPRRYRLDVQKAPLMRAYVAHDRAQDRWLLLQLRHHLASDHTARDVVLSEIRAYMQGRTKDLPDPLPFRNFVARARLAVSRAEHEAYFRELLEGVNEPTAPFGLLDVHGDGTGIDEAREPMSDELAGRLRNRARRLGVSPATICHLAWAQVVARTSGRTDVVFGTVLIGRMMGGADRVIGPFMNTLPVRVRLDEVSVEESVRHMHRQLAELLGHEHASLALAQRCGGVEAPMPLFTALLNYRHAAALGRATTRTHGSSPWKGIRGVYVEERTNYPLTMSVDDLVTRFFLTAKVRAPFQAERVCAMMIRALATLLDALEAAPDTPARDLDVLPEAERSQVVEGWNVTAADYPSQSSVHALFEAQAEHTPDAVAVVFEGEALSYAKLDARANRLARRLAARGVGPDACVGICVEHSLEMVVGLLAVLKAGGAYVPLDPGYPPERLHYMLEDSAPVAVLTTPEQRGLFAGLATAVPVLDIAALAWSASPRDCIGGGGERRREDCCGWEVAPEHLAYVMYTSGSTGTPKGVAVTHRCVVNRLAWTQRAWRLGVHDAVLQGASLSFDVSVYEVFWPLAVGGCVVLLGPEGQKDPGCVVATIRRERIHTASFVPSMLQLFLEHPEVTGCAALEYAPCGGEALAPGLVDRFQERLADTALYNRYGPTEAALAVTACLRARGKRRAVVPIGRPVSNVRVYIVNGTGEPVPVGVVGELWIGGAGVARGYLGRPDQTANRFVADPFGMEAGGRVYRTGDLARWFADGTVEFLGRNDGQVKVRGFRVEPAEIETSLEACAGVREAAVVTLAEEGCRRLVAYYTGEAVAAERLRSQLAEELPEYMVPAAYMRLEVLPLTRSGKLDRRALPAPAADAYARRGYEPPVGEGEIALAEIWSDVLGVERVGRWDDFFELGGHSLLAVQVIIRVRQVLSVDAALRELFARPTLADFARVLEQAMRVELPPIERADRRKRLALSFAQQRLWFLEQLGGTGNLHHIRRRLRLLGAMHAGALRRALDRIVARHESLRTTFVVVDDEPEQRIAPAEKSSFALTEDDLSGDDNAEAKLDRIAAEELETPFDFAHGPLIRGRLIRMGAEDHVLLLDVHHIITDAWSMGVFFRELNVLYGTYERGEPDPLPPLEVQYADYAAWQRRWIDGEVLTQQAAYWQRRLAGAPTLLALPTDHPRTAGDYEGAAVDIELDAELTAGLRALSRRAGTTLFMTLLAGWAAVLSRLSGQQDVVIGAPTANRGQREIDGLIGFFVNTLALRLDLSGSPTVAELLSRVKERTLEAQQNQDIPFEQVVEVHQPARSVSHSPLFQVLFAWQNVPRGRPELPGVRLVRMSDNAHLARFDLSLALKEVGGRIVGGLIYPTSLFERSTVERHVDYLRHVLEAMTTDERQRVGRLALLSEAERRRLDAPNETAATYPAGLCIHELFEAQAERTPDAVAAVFEHEALTYAELNARANCLAHHLAVLGVRPDARVGIFAERSLDMVVGVLGTLKAGGAYVPLDPSNPNERLRYMLEESAPMVLLTQRSTRRCLEGLAIPIIELDGPTPAWAARPAENPERGALTPEHLAYVIYTSGSTGRPKAVMNEHRGVLNLLAWAQRVWQLGPREAVLQKIPLSFDVSVRELFWPLSVGARIVLAHPSGHRDADYLVDVVCSHRITTFHLLPSMLQVLLEHPRFGRCIELRRVMAGGEPLSSVLVQRFHRLLPDAALFHMYGPTETKVGVTLQRCTGNEEGANLPIGKPVANTRVHLLDGEVERAPLGAVGEVCIGGVQVGRGYWNAPEATAEQFVADPFSREAGARLYRTGDLARWLEDGTLEFVGRRDEQVKVRGYRIELGEIEERLKAHGAVREVVVTAQADAFPDTQLVAYYVERMGIDPAALRSHLATQLPEYMVPAAFVRLAALPLSPNGKVDRRSLPAPDSAAYVSRAYEPPLGTTEQELAHIWAEVLRIERVGRHDHFFELGGHSLLATKVLVRIKQTIDVDISLRAIFERPVLSSFAEHVLDAQLAAYDPVELARLT